MADTGPEPEHNEDPEPDHPEDEAKRKFREALDRKRAREADANGGRAGTDAGKVHGAHGPALSRRSFRRKSG
ncbi:MAG TPA: DUF5302 domain-containing protein [Streptosporangiaceae bacterium]|nr:DUF5302 domain-containing protein [Streptosporangiaceae bacterium]